MSGSHHPTPHHLHVPGRSPIHHLAPEAKLAGLAAFVLVVAFTPRHQVAVFAVAAAAVATVVALARLPLRLVLIRLAVVLPFVAFAFFIPLVGTGERVEVVWFSVSVDGLWAMWNILAKAGIGASATVVVAATTPVPDIVQGLQRLHLPGVIVGIVGFMFRYLDLVAAQLGRMRDAMTARGHDPRWLWQVRPIASSLGALFVRTYERGERVHHAMVARGYDGAVPELSTRRATPQQWCLATIPAIVALTALGLALVGR